MTITVLNRREEERSCAELRASYSGAAGTRGSLSAEISSGTAALAHLAQEKRSLLQHAGNSKRLD